MGGNKNWKARFRAQSADEFIEAMKNPTIVPTFVPPEIGRFLASEIKRLKEERGLSDKDIFEKPNVSRTALSNFLKGREMLSSGVEPILAVFDLTMNEMLEKFKKQPPTNSVAPRSL